MLRITKINLKTFFFCLLIIVLFKPTWLISTDGLGVGSDDLSYWIHTSTIAFDFDLDYKDDHSLDHPNYHKITNAPFHSPGSAYANSIFVKIFSFFDEKSETREIRNNPIGSYALLGYLFGSLVYCLLGFYFFDKLLEIKRIFINKKIVYLLIYFGTVVHYVSNRFLMAHSFEFFLVMFIFYLFESKKDLFEKSIFFQLVFSFFLLSITRPSTFIFSLCLFVVYHKKFKFNISNLIVNFGIFFLTVFVYVTAAQKIYDQNSFLLNLNSNNTTAGIANDINIQWILSGFSNLLNLVFSPSLGLLWSTPVIIMGVISLFFNKKYYKELNLFSKLFLFLYFFGAFLVLIVWQGREASFGQRLLVGIIPICAYQLCLYLNNKKINFLIPFVIILFFGNFFLYSSQDLTLKLGTTLWGTQNEFAAQSYYYILFYEIFSLENWASSFTRTIFFINLVSIFDFLDNFNIFELSKIREQNFNNYISKIDNLKILYLIFYNSVVLGFTLFFEKLTKLKS